MVRCGFSVIVTAVAGAAGSITIRLLRTLSISSYVTWSPAITRSLSSAENVLSQSMLIAASYICLCSMAVLHCAFVQGALKPTKVLSYSGPLICSGRSFQNLVSVNCSLNALSIGKRSTIAPRHHDMMDFMRLATSHFKHSPGVLGSLGWPVGGCPGGPGNGATNGATCNTGTVCTEPPAASEARDDAGAFAFAAAVAGEAFAGAVACESESASVFCFFTGGSLAAPMALARI